MAEDAPNTQSQRVSSITTTFKLHTSYTAAECILITAYSKSLPQALSLEPVLDSLCSRDVCVCV